MTLESSDLTRSQIGNKKPKGGGKMAKPKKGVIPPQFRANVAKKKAAKKTPTRSTKKK